MSVTSTVLFNQPRSEMASLIAPRIVQSTATSIITGFATPGGVAAIAAPIMANPACRKTCLVGAALVIVGTTGRQDARRSDRPAQVRAECATRPASASELRSPQDGHGRN
jgi:hypothetical protein